MLSTDRLVTAFAVAVATVGSGLYARGAAARAGGEDQGLLERIVDGDQTALASLYDRHAHRLYALAARITARERDAEEVVQDVFVRVWTQAVRYDAHRGPILAWLLVMTRSRALDRVRARRARPDGDPSPTLDALDTAADADETVEHRLIADEQVARVRAALDALPAAQRDAIELAYYGGLTHVEIAARLQEPLGTVKTRLRAALTKLRDACKERA